MGFSKTVFFSVSVLFDFFNLLISTLHRVDIEAIEFLFCHNNLNSTYEAVKTGFDFLPHKMWLFWLHFGFGLIAGVDVAPTKNSLDGLYAHAVKTAYGENKSKPIKQFRKKIDFSNPIFLSIHFNETAPGAKNNATTVFYFMKKIVLSPHGSQIIVISRPLWSLENRALS